MGGVGRQRRASREDCQAPRFLILPLASEGAQTARGTDESGEANGEGPDIFWLLRREETRSCCDRGLHKAPCSQAAPDPLCESALDLKLRSRTSAPVSLHDIFTRSLM